MLPLPFDNPTTYKGHVGVDFGQPLGTDILASGDGVIVFSGKWNSRAGWGVIVRYDIGIEVLYCHMPEDSPRPTVGTRVKEGSYIGEVGTSGNSTGYHLHMEIMTGKGAHTYDGIWLYFNKATVASLQLEPIINQEDEDEMAKNSGFIYTRAKDKAEVVLICNTESGFEHEYMGVKSDYHNPVAAAFGTGNYARITENHAEAIKRALAATRGK